MHKAVHGGLHAVEAGAYTVDFVVGVAAEDVLVVQKRTELHLDVVCIVPLPVFDFEQADVKTNMGNVFC